MGLPKPFWDEMRYLAGIYQWSDEDKREMKAWVLGDPQAVEYCLRLAASWRAAERGWHFEMYDYRYGKYREQEEKVVEETL